MIPLTNEQQKLELRKIFIPLTAAEIIWDYVDRVLRYCADHRISETMKLSRAVKKLHESYDDFIRRNLDWQHRELVRAACEDFKQAFSYDLTVMFCTISNELNYKYVGQHITYQDMRVNALGSIMLLRALRSMPGMARLPKLKDLDEIMDAYVAPYELDLTRNVEICQKVLAKRLAEVPYMECKLRL